MTNKLGEVIDYGCCGGKAIAIHAPMSCGRTAVQLPDCMKDVPAGMIAYIDDEGRIAFMDGDPNEEWDE